MLSSRSKEILKMLILAQQPLRIKNLAQDFQVSERTIKYDLDGVRTWLKEHNILIHSQPNRGIWVECDEEESQNMLEWLHMHGSQDIFLHQNERARFIALELICQDGYLRINDLSEILAVSRNTIIGDLEEVERFCSRWQLVFERKVRVGLRITGQELHVRLAIEQLMHEILSGYEMLKIVQSITQEHDVPSFALSFYQWLKLDERDQQLVKQTINSLAHRVSNDLSIYFSDRLLISLLIRISIVIQRLCHGTDHLLDRFEISLIHQFSIFEYFQQDMKVLFDQLGLPITDKEVAFICMPTIRMVIDPTALDDVTGDAQQNEMFAVTKRLIEAVSSRLEIPFNEDRTLLESLFAHMSDRVVKYRNGVLDPNPLTDEIIRMFPGLFTTLKQICIEHLKDYQLFLTNSDIAYIVLHFQAAFERIKDREQFRVLLVCGTGRGSATLLKTYLEKEMRNLHIVGLCSSIEVNQFLQKTEVDLIISVIPIQASVPVVEISALPTKNDKDKVKVALRKIQEEMQGKKVGNEQRKRLQTSSKQFPEIPIEITSKVENLTQEVILQGFEIGMKLTTQFVHLLPGNRQQGLLLHILLMLNRLRFGTPYMEYEAEGLQESKHMQRYRLALEEFFNQEQLQIPSSEVSAIMRYFTEERSIQ
ncbi:BglG family transcription antiterminator [Brevibacillus daliensis]|uniref:BglG family transcription antiterminator n=1 Tax=Brevibacillus daliensis TaxID=2892995 RepID=UPI001E3A0187|nr:transcription antiterminator [Brevibacillus daliensis]